jgi:hypothetical protein
MKVVHGESVEARSAFVEMMDSYLEEGDCWMAALWVVRDGKITLVRRTTWKFPVGDYEIAMEQLKHSTQLEKFPPRPTELESADLLSLKEEINYRKRLQSLEGDGSAHLD